MDCEKLKKMLLTHCEKYKKLQPEDVFKFLYHSSFGCEHAVQSLSDAIARIEEESGSVTPVFSDIEPLDGGYCRVPLNILSPEILGKIFYLSAKPEPEGEKLLLEKLAASKALANEGLFPFSAEEYNKKATEWEKEGFPALHHSDIFKKEYKPSYRVIKSEFVPFLPLLSELEKRLKNGPLTVAIEGGSGSGKSTLGDLINFIFPSALFHADDFFLPPERKTAERLEEIGGNLDRERLQLEILEPLKLGNPVNYRRFDCSLGTLSEPISVMPNRLNIIEGAYSMHPSLAPFYDFSVFLCIDKETQARRILKRNPDFSERFFKEWIPLEDRYFKETDIKNRCDLIIDIKD